MGEPESERSLATRARAGDPDAWARSTDLHGETLVAAGAKELRDPTEAGIKARETIALAWEIRDRLDVEQPILNWLLGIHRNLIRNYQRARGVRERVHGRPAGGGEGGEEDQVPAGEAEGVDPELDAKRARDRKILLELIEGLREDQREAVLAQLEGLTCQQIADEMGVKFARVKTLLHTGLKALAKAMTAHDPPLTWEDFIPLVRRQLPRPKIKNVTKREGPDDGATDRRADRAARQAPAGDPDPGGPGEAGGSPQGPGKKGGLG